MDNYAIAEQFSLLAKLMEVHGENSFKTKTYSIAAFNIEKLAMQLASIPREDIFRQKGIGDSVGRKVIEMLETGRLGVLEEYLAKTPQGVLDMMRIKGIGPKKINIIWKELGIESLGELLYACEENRLKLNKGFGEKTQNNIRESILFFLQHQGHFLFAEIEEKALALNQQFNSDFPGKEFRATGAFFRQAEVIDLLEWCTTVSKEDLKNYFKDKSIETDSETDDSLDYKLDNIHLRFHLCTDENITSKTFETGCSPEFLKEWKQRFTDLPPCKDEKTMFEAAGIFYIPNYLREEASIIAKATSELPAVVQYTDIKGVIHSHSTWSDGLNTIREMAEACIKDGFEYLVISDHSKSAFYANGLSEERIIEQHEEINILNGELAPFRIFKSIECDILNDGSLDYNNEVLASFDFVIASVHSNLRMTEEKATARILKALENPYVTILGHMTGRLLLSRAGYPLDHQKIIDSCAEKKIVVELNAHPRRLDIDWRWIPYALEKGVILSIDPDAHSVEGFRDIRYGVLAAQKGRLVKEQNLSSFSLEEMERFLSQRSSAR